MASVHPPAERLQPGDALLIVDVQPDFCPGGALPVPAGDEVIPALNAWIDAASRRGVPVYASRDWHPPEHGSFREAGGPWPPHCVQDTPGAAFHPDLRLPAGTARVTKGTRLDRDQYSAFDETGLAEHLRQRGIKRVWIGGLAEDVCVRASALDAKKAGFETLVILPATRAITPEGAAATRSELRAAGVRLEA